MRRCLVLKIKELFGSKKIFALIITLAAIIALLLTTVLVLIFSGYKKDVGEPDLLGEMLGKIADSDPEVYLCELEYLIDGVKLCGEYRLTLEAEKEDRAVLEYRYDRLGRAGEDDSFTVSEEGTLYAKGEDEVGELINGAVVWENGAIASDISPIKLSKESLKSFEITEKDGVRYLEAVLDKSVVGYEASCVFECDAQKGDLLKLTLEYTDKYGAKVNATYTYLYSA